MIFFFPFPFPFPHIQLPPEYEIIPENELISSLTFDNKATDTQKKFKKRMTKEDFEKEQENEIENKNENQNAKEDKNENKNEGGKEEDKRKIKYMLICSTTKAVFPVRFEHVRIHISFSSSLPIPLFS